MIARWYNEEITKVVTGKKIDYRVNQSFPPDQQDFTEIFLSLSMITRQKSHGSLI